MMNTEQLSPAQQLQEARNWLDAHGANTSGRNDEQIYRMLAERFPGGWLVFLAEQCGYGPEL